jgi:hypothetical protein
MDEVRELDGRLDEEDGDVVSHDIEIALVSVTSLWSAKHLRH